MGSVWTTIDYSLSIVQQEGDQLDIKYPDSKSFIENLEKTEIILMNDNMGLMVGISQIQEQKNDEGYEVKIQKVMIFWYDIQQHTFS